VRRNNEGSETKAAGSTDVLSGLGGKMGGFKGRGGATSPTVRLTRINLGSGN
jgi:hypothetical protein